MRRSLALAILLAAFASLAAAQSKAPAAKPAALPERFKKWLDEEVVYIISRHEREVFGQLQTDRERDIFVEAFWKHRDPTPGTPRNEFEEEHYRRLNYANTVLGRSTPRPGWRTDRGRIYIILGPPRNIEQFDSTNGVYPTEIWFYLGDPALGLPTAFNIIFFKREGTGDYILYSPTEHGPASLIASGMGGYRDVTRTSGAMTNDQAAYKQLKELDPNLAPQTLSLIPGEAAQPGYESLASVKLLASIASVPTKKVEVDYADAILKYKDFVEVEYTANYISGDFQVQVIRDETGAAFVHYSIEPARITVEEAGGRYEVRFLLTGRVSDGAGKTIHQFDKEFPFSLTAAEVDDLRSKTISIQDVFPLVPGVYTFDILLKNVLSKEFTGAGRTITVPGPAGPPALSPLLLAYGLEPGAADRGGKVPFKVGGTQILCQTKKGFGTKDSLVLFYQLSGLTDELRKTSSLATVFLREDQEVLRRTLPVADTPASGVIDVQDLRTFTPGYYQVRVSLVDGAGRELALARENFEISLAPALPRPMVMAKVASSGGAEDGLLTTGRQLANEGNFEAAAEKLAAAHVRAPQRPDIAVAYAQVLFRQKDYARVLDVLRPFEGDDTPAPEVPALLGQACHALARYDEAAKYYTAYITRFGANIDILNYLGTCHFQLGNTAQALQAWEKSLELSPNQEKLRALVDSIKKR